MSTPGTLRNRLYAWCAAMAVMLLLFAGEVLPHLKFDTDILALLPQDGRDTTMAQALDRFADRFGRNAVFVVSAGQFGTASKAAQGFADVLQASPAFAEVRLTVDLDWPQRSAGAYLPYRDRLLSGRARSWLEAGDDPALLSHARQALYTPAAFLRRSPAASDPLDLFGDFLDSATPAAGRFSLHDDLLVATVNGPPPRQSVLVRTLLAGDAFSTAEEEVAGAALDRATAIAQAAGAAVSGSGLIQHAMAASRLARREVDVFGGIQLLCVVGILLAVFRSSRVLLLSATALSLGVVAALTACHYVFGHVHVLALVFCSNLAGIAIDYSIYYCADQFRAPGRWNAADALPHIGRAIGMSCVVALASYALLAVAPFPGLRQIALFCCVGLAVVYVSVIAWFPLGIRPAPARLAERLSSAFRRGLALRERLAAAGRRWWLIAAIAAAATPGMLRLQFQDDVRVLQPDTPELSRQEGEVRGLLGNIPDSRFFLVTAADAESLLQAEERLRVQLDPLIAQGRLHAYTAISQGLPSQARQVRDRQLLAARVFNPGGLSERIMREIGFTEPAIRQRAADFARDGAPLTAEAWLGTAAADPYRHLWLGDSGAGVASVVTLSGVDDPAAVTAAAAAVPGVRLVDRVAEVNEVLRRYRRIASWIVFASVFASALLLAVPYGLERGVSLMLAPTVAVLAVPALFGWLGVPMSLFNVVALHLVLGLSMEYAILLQLAELRGPSTLLSATLAALLALLAFGLLALSATGFIHALGLTTAIGVAFGYTAAAVLGTIPRRHPSPEHS